MDSSKGMSGVTGQGPIAMGSGPQAMLGGMPNQGPTPNMGVSMNPKLPMDPVKKKKILAGCLIGAGTVILAIVAVVVLAIVNQVDYSETYKVAKELKPKIYDIYQDYDCGYVTEFVKSTYTSEKTYSGYVEGCKKVSDGVEDLVMKLGATVGVERNAEIKEAFGKFQESLAEVLPNQEELRETLKTYETWHKFVVMKNGLAADSSTDAEVRTVANVLIESENEILKSYGEGWLTVTLAQVQATQAYYNAGYLDPKKSELRTEMNNKQTEQKNWVAANQPDIIEVGKLSATNNMAMYDDYMKLYNLIRDAYAENYDGSGMCTEVMGMVYCE